MQMQKTHVVIVPASFAPPLLYSDFVQHLSEYGLRATVVDLPSVGNRDPLPAASMMDDADHAKMVTTKLADDGYEIILMMHSYGGVCGTESTARVSNVRGKPLRNQGVSFISSTSALQYLNSVDLSCLS
ncbi:hypothetical protein N7488_012472 [Penicillium malachiteum]|nr:hypothetical protein N7488_012472 [Penicillium malachiteum]